MAMPAPPTSMPNPGAMAGEEKASWTAPASCMPGISEFPPAEMSAFSTPSAAMPVAPSALPLGTAEGGGTLASSSTGMPGISAENSTPAMPLSQLTNQRRPSGQMPTPPGQSTSPMPLPPGQNASAMPSLPQSSLPAPQATMMPAMPQPTGAFGTAPSTEPVGASPDTAAPAPASSQMPAAPALSSQMPPGPGLARADSSPMPTPPGQMGAASLPTVPLVDATSAAVADQRPLADVAPATAAMPQVESFREDPAPLPAPLASPPVSVATTPAPVGMDLSQMPPPPAQSVEQSMMPPPPAQSVEQSMMPPPPAQSVEQAMMQPPPVQSAEQSMMPPKPAQSAEPSMMPPPLAQSAEPSMMPPPPAQSAEQSTAPPPPAQSAEPSMMPPPPAQSAEPSMMPPPPVQAADVGEAAMPASPTSAAHDEIEESPQIVGGFPVPSPKKERFQKKRAEQAAKAAAGADAASEPSFAPGVTLATAAPSPAPSAAAPVGYPGAAAAPALKVPSSPFPPAPQSQGLRLSDGDQRFMAQADMRALPPPAPAAPVALPAPCTTPAYPLPATAALGESPGPCTTTAPLPLLASPRESCTTPVVPYQFPAPAALAESASTTPAPSPAPAPAPATAPAPAPAPKPAEAADEPEEAWHPGPLEGEAARDVGPEYPPDFQAYPGWTPTPGFTPGRWEYICVDPKGVGLRRTYDYNRKHKTGGEINFGEQFIVCERGEEGRHMWLCLADGRGWAIERTNRRRCSEVHREEVPANQRQKLFMVKPNLGYNLEYRPTPVAGHGAALDGLLPGSTVWIRERCCVTSQRKGAKEKEDARIFLRIQGEDVGFVSEGSVGKKNNVEGWLPELMNNGQPSLLEPCYEHLQANPSSPCWISVTAASGTPIFPCPGRVHSGKKVGVGDICPIVASCTTDGARFYYKLADGGWVADGDAKNKKQFELVTREEHWWQYSCVDKDGAAIRHAPTRSHKMDTGKKLKHRQRVISSEIVKFPSGDSFIHVEPPTNGWVPVLKVGGDAKMKPLSPIDPKMRPGNKVPAGATLGPKSFAPPGPQMRPPQPPMSGAPGFGAPPGSGYGAPPGSGYGAPPGSGYGMPPQGPPPYAGMRPPHPGPVPGNAFAVGAMQGPPMGQFGAPQGGYGMSGPQAGYQNTDFGI